MRLTHSPALRGLAVLGASAAVFASAMLAGAQAASASAPAAPANADQTAIVALNDQSVSLPSQQLLRDEGDNAEGTEAEMTQDRHGDQEDRDEHHKKCHHHHDKGKAESEENWGDPDGKDEHHKKCHRDGREKDEENGEENGEEHGDRDEHHKKCHHHRPWGSVESGEGGMAVASEQSPTTSVSLGVASAVLLGSGLWLVRRTRRFGAVK